jgi:polyisoprenoid-binding protein YceI
MRFRLVKPGLVKLGAALLATLPLAGQERAIDTQRSMITIHVGKAGLLSAAGHEHWVSAPIDSGVIDTGAASVAFKVQSAKMTVKPDPKFDAKTQDQIQKDMEEMTLETSKYPEIAFRSTDVEKVAADQFKVDGILTLHGVSKPVSVKVKREGESYTGHTVIQQTDFGIKPISFGGGTIKVKNSLDIDFEIFSRAGS